MAAPKGNKFWELRSKHGPDKLFDTPELLWDAACQYFEWCEKDPFYQVEQIKSPGKPYYDQYKDRMVTPLATIKLPKMRPFTMQGLCIYLDCNTAYFRQFKDRLKEKPNEDGFYQEQQRLNRIAEIKYLRSYMIEQRATVNKLASYIKTRDAKEIKEYGKIPYQILVFVANKDRTVRAPLQKFKATFDIKDLRSKINILDGIISDLRGIVNGYERTDYERSEHAIKEKKKTSKLLKRVHQKI